MTHPSNIKATTEEPQDTPQTIQWCLISHTNIGKTTLVRTLLGEDVGDIRDAAHVTDSADAYTLLETQLGNRLTLWDTPGFGDSVRLQQRLAQQGNPMGWFLSHVWDRWRDKPFWMSQRAMAAARTHADIVLYLVNATEDPQDAGYLEAEMRILAWLQKPVVVLLNQLGHEQTPAQMQQDLSRWQTAMQVYTPPAGVVRHILPLDAFSRSWLHEQALFHTVARLLEPTRKNAWQDITQTWEQRNQQRLQDSMAALAEFLFYAAAQTHVIEQSSPLGWKKAGQMLGLSRESQNEAESLAMQKLLKKVDQQSAQTTMKLLQLHRLDGSAAEQIREQLQEYFSVNQPLDPARIGLWGAIASGAATGAGADLAAGGLTLGSGMLLGAVVGALGFAGAAWGFNESRGNKEHNVKLSDAFLDSLVESSLLNYLAIMHFGRGRGSFAQGISPAHWREAIASVNAQEQTKWHVTWAEIRALASLTEARNTAPEQANDARTSLQKRMEDLLTSSSTAILAELYPATSAEFTTPKRGPNA